MNNTPLYTGTSAEARAEGQLQQWKDSQQANILCRIAIESEIRQRFDGMYLDAGCAERVVEQFGFDRVRYVLAATVQEKDYDGRFSRSNKAWAAQTSVSGNHQFIVESHPAVLDGFISQFRELQQELQADSSRMGIKGAITMC